MKWSELNSPAFTWNTAAATHQVTALSADSWRKEGGKKKLDEIKFSLAKKICTSFL